MKVINTSVPLIFCVGGPSLKILDDNIEYFRDKIVYWSVEQLEQVIDKKILSKIEQHNNFFSSIDTSFLPCFINQARLYEDVYYILHKERNKDILSQYKNIPENLRERVIPCDYDHDAGLYLLLFPFLGLGFKNVFIFGMDGQYVDGKRYYIDEYHKIKNIDMPDNPSGFLGDMKSDIEKMDRFWEFAEMDLGEKWSNGLFKSNVYNMCTSSKVGCFSKITFEEMKEIISDESI